MARICASNSLSLLARALFCCCVICMKARGDPAPTPGMLKPAPGDVAAIWPPLAATLKDAIMACALAMKFCWFWFMPLIGMLRMPFGDT